MSAASIPVGAGEPSGADLSLAAGLNVVLFYCGAHRIGIEASRVRASRALETGTSATRDAAVLLGLEPSAAPAVQQLLVIKGEPEDETLRVGGPIELQTLEAETIHPLPPLLAARTGLRHLRGLALTTEGAVLLVDVRSLLD